MLARLAPIPLLVLVSCAAPDGLRMTPAGSGPSVVADWDALPLPEIPFPNDLATRPDPTSPTGLRLNLSEQAPTELEREARRKANELTGFGAFTPITVGFDRPLDLDDIAHRHDPDLDPSDDAFFVIDVTPGSPTYLQAVDLDIGHGRFPGDLVQSDRYFPNDTRSHVPSLLFETHDEDVDSDGVFDVGEDTDGDGLFDDKPNVFPEGGDPRQDLLTWYERQSDTLIIRPVVPLREETRYAVVLTERLVGEDGQPVRSPWTWVHHLRQTEALRPLEEALPPLGLSLDDVAFAWSFTTGRITGDLRDLRRGLYGEGPFAYLHAEYPPAIHTAMPLQNSDREGGAFRVPAERLFGVLSSAGVYSEEEGEVLEDYYRWAEAVVGGKFTSPDLMVDRDDNGGDTSDEWWQIDAHSGTLSHAPRDIAFNCVLPAPDADHQPPYDVVLYGHGYGSTRFEFLAFAWGLAKVGKAACAMDFPGHGLDVGPEEEELIGGLLDAAGLFPFFEAIGTDRARDLDNDGRKNSGADQWIADGFHTRDMVRQAVVDWMQWVRALRMCGQGSMNDVDGDGQDEVTCDWDGDGVADIGGADAKISLLGGSLGGINAGVAAAVEPEFTTVVPVVAGGGLMDVGWRSNLSGVAEAVVGKVMNPMLMGFPDGAGGLRISQYLVSAVEMREVPVAHLDTVPVGGSIRLENLSNGEVREGPIAADGTFRLGVASDAADPYEKRVLTNMPEEGPQEGVVYEVEGNEGLGDRWRIVVRDGDGQAVQSIETFEQDAVFEGVTVRAGSPLVALASGLAHIRGTPRLRRIVNVLAMVTEPADPALYAPHYVTEPFPEVGRRRVLLVPNPGDTIVPVATELSVARAAGFIGRHEIDPRYGRTVDQWLIDNEVVRGLEEWGPFRNKDDQPILFDADNLDDFQDGFGAPSDAPLRATFPQDDGSVSGFRMTYSSVRGDHSFGFPQPTRRFDIGTYSVMMMARYVHSDGTEILDDPCLEDASCAFIRPLPVSP